MNEESRKAIVKSPGPPIVRAMALSQLMKARKTGQKGEAVPTWAILGEAS